MISGKKLVGVDEWFGSFTWWAIEGYVPGMFSTRKAIQSLESPLSDQA
jgi:hypothetical protein